jgi:hypothetical protein
MKVSVGLAFEGWRRSRCMVQKPGGEGLVCVGRCPKDWIGVERN